MRESKKWVIGFWLYAQIAPYFALGATLTLIIAGPSSHRGGSSSGDILFIGLALVAVYQLLIYKWFMCDAQESGIFPAGGLKVCIFLLPIVGVPYYLIKYKGFKDGIKSISIIILLFICTIGIDKLIVKLLTIIL